MTHQPQKWYGINIHRHVEKTTLQIHSREHSTMRKLVPDILQLRDGIPGWICPCIQIHKISTYAKVLPMLTLVHQHNVASTLTRASPNQHPLITQTLHLFPDPHSLWLGQRCDPVLYLPRHLQLYLEREVRHQPQICLPTSKHTLKLQKLPPHFPPLFR